MNPAMMALIVNPLRANFQVTRSARALNTTFMPSAVRPTLVVYNIDLNSGSVAAGANGGARVDLLVGAASPPTERRDFVYVRNTRSSLATGTSAVEVSKSLSWIVPAGHNVRLASTLFGSGTAAIDTDQWEATL